MSKTGNRPKFSQGYEIFFNNVDLTKYLKLQLRIKAKNMQSFQTKDIDKSLQRTADSIEVNKKIC